MHVHMKRSYQGTVWLLAHTHQPGGQNTASPAGLLSLDMEFRLTFSWLHIMSILLDQKALFEHPL